MTSNKMLRTLLILGACTAGFDPTYAQLYLLTGNPTPKSPEAFASTLLEVGPTGSITVREEIASLTAGTWWIDADYSARKMVILTRYPEAAVVVVDMDQAAISKKCHQKGGLYYWLASVPVAGASIVFYDWDADVTKTHLWGMSLDASTPCEKSYHDLAPADSMNLVMGGRAGVAGIAAQEVWVVSADNDGHFHLRLGADDIRLGFQLPRSILAEFTAPNATVLVNNAQILVTVVSNRGSKNRALSAFRKRDGTWLRVPTSVSGLPSVRAFGQYVVIAETQEKSAANPESPGGQDWRSSRRDTGPSIAQAFRNADVVYPGRLHVYDVDRQRNYVIVTNQGDSEVLLVENDTVYYRVSDGVYSAGLTDQGLGPARLLATSDSVRDAHWAFLKR